MLNLRVRLAEDDGTIGRASRVLEVLNLTYTDNSGAPTLKFSVSRDTFTPAAYPFIVRVEYSANGSRFSPLPEHELFIVEDDSDDSKDDVVRRFPVASVDPHGPAYLHPDELSCLTISEEACYRSPD